MLVGRINGRFGNAAWTPVQYLRRSLPFQELVALYRAADVMLVTPVRDGMNLVAKEFVASRIDGDGVVVLSEFAGAASELAGALPVNPYDIRGAAGVYHRALTMGEGERRGRMATLRDQVRTSTVRMWSERFLADLGRRDPRPRQDASPHEVLTTIREARTLRLLIDYDGTPVPFASRPEDASPDSAVLDLLGRLAGRAGTEVHLVSGRARDVMTRWFGHLPIGLHAEHGTWSRLRPGDAWRRAHLPDPAWREVVHRILARFVEATPGAELEEKDFSLAWHYRQADPETAARQAVELTVHLTETLVGQPAEVLEGNCVIEVRARGVHKGLAVHLVRSVAPPDARLVAVGDDRTDDDMFASLPAGGIALAVGPVPERADLRFDDYRGLRAWLERLAARPAAPGLLEPRAAKPAARRVAPA